MRPAGRQGGAGCRSSPTTGRIDGALGERDAFIVSQFTLYGDGAKAADPPSSPPRGPDIAVPLYEEFINAVKAQGIPTATGRFGAMMQVELVNDGPVTLLLELA